MSKIVTINGEHFRVHPHGGGLTAVESDVDPSAYVESECRVGVGAQVGPDVWLHGKTSVEADAVVKNSSLTDVQVGVGATVDNVVLNRVTIHPGGTVDACSVVSAF